MKKFKPQMLIPIAILVAMGIGGWYVEAERDRQRSVLSGFFESQPTQVSARVTGRISRILVEEGEFVHKGQPLIELETTPAKEDMLARQAQAEQAHQQLREVENGPRLEDIRRQEAAVAEAIATLDRLKNGSRPQEIEQARAAERNARARLAQAKRGLTAEERAQAKARLGAATAAQDLAQRETDRMQKLYKDGAISQQQLDQTQTSLQEAKAKRDEQEKVWQRADNGTPPEELEQAAEAYKQAKATLDLVLAGSRREDILVAQARLDQANATLAELRAGSRKEQIAQAKAAAESTKASARSSEANLSERIVRAPINGIVQRTLVSEGDLVGSGTTLLRLDNPTDIWMRVYIPEAKLSNVAVGNTTELRVDGIDEPIAAYVESIATRGEFTPANLQTPNERGKQVFAVRLRLKSPDPRVKAGMYVTVKQIGKWRP